MLKQFRFLSFSYANIPLLDEAENVRSRLWVLFWFREAVGDAGDVETWTGPLDTPVVVVEVAGLKGAVASIFVSKSSWTSIVPRPPKSSPLSLLKVQHVRKTNEQMPAVNLS